MYDTFFIALTAVLAVFCVIAAGFVLRRIGVLQRESDQSLLSVVVNFLMPCLILDRVLPSDVFYDVRNLVYPPLIGFGIIVFGMFFAASIGFLPRRWTGLESRKKIGTFAACVGMLNYGFVPIPLVQVLFGDQDPTMGVLFVQNLGVEFALWTVGLLMIRGTFDRNSWKHAINGPTIAIMVAIPLNLIYHSPYFPAFGIEFLGLFSFVKDAMHLLGLSAIPMSMLLIGATLGDHLRWNHYHANPGTVLKISFWSCLIRMGILPGLILLIAVFLPCSLELKRVIVLHAAMGSAVFPIVMSQHYGGDHEVAIDTVLSNSLISLLGVPLWIDFGLRVIA